VLTRRDWPGLDLEREDVNSREVRAARSYPMNARQDAGWTSFSGPAVSKPAPVRDGASAAGRRTVSRGIQLGLAQTCLRSGNARRSTR